MFDTCLSCLATAQKRYFRSIYLNYSRFLPNYMPDRFTGADTKGISCYFFLFSEIGGAFSRLKHPVPLPVDFKTGKAAGKPFSSQLYIGFLYTPHPEKQFFSLIAAARIQSPVIFFCEKAWSNSLWAVGHLLDVHPQRTVPQGAAHILTGMGKAVMDIRVFC